MEENVYEVKHVRHGCYEVLMKKDDKTIYLTNFRNKKAVEKFIKAHQKGKVTIDPETCIPTPDFK
tara:strand:+ start:1471 stop:1665 length:195 start_codon:yes stop_codon:yes gene_type:complete